MDLEERPRVHDVLDHGVDVVGGIRVLGHEAGELRGRGVTGGARGRWGRVLEIVERKVAEDPPGERDRIAVRRGSEMRDPAHSGVGFGPTERLHRDLLAGHGPHDVRAGDEHLSGALRHDDEIGDRGRVHRAARARAKDERKLRNYAREEDVAEEHLAVPPEAHHALLDAGAARVVEPDDGDPGLAGCLHDLDDLHRVGLAERPPEDGGVLRERADRPAVDFAPTRDDPIARDAPLLHPEGVDAVGHERVDLRERTGVEERLEAVPSGELPRRAVSFDAIGPSAVPDFLLENGPAVERLAHGASATRTSPAHIATRSVAVDSQSSPSSPSASIVPAGAPSTVTCWPTP